MSSPLDETGQDCPPVHREGSSRPSPDENSSLAAKAIIIQYLLDRVPEFQELQEIRDEGWQNPAGDRFFAKQRSDADNATEKTKQYFFKLMQRIAEEMNADCGALAIEDGDMMGHKQILDTCMAPGGFLSVVLRLNPNTNATGFTLPVSSGGHNVLLRERKRVKVQFQDVTMMASDLGVTEIPDDHAEKDKFVSRQLEAYNLFDLVICDGQVLRTHVRLEYREKSEARRLTTSQLILGLSHLKPGGTMVILLHKVEAWDTVLLLYKFSKFSNLHLFKPTCGHAKRSSFYMVARDVQSQHPEALAAMEKWRQVWKAATFATDEEYRKTVWGDEPSVQDVLADFGPELIRLGKKVWTTQAKALTDAPFNRRNS